MTVAIPPPAILEAAAREVEADLDAALARVAGGAAARLREAMRYSLLGGGKRLRPALTWAACEALGRSVGSEDRDWACSLEMVHTYSLVHDDLPAMDNDDLRRGRPTSHKVFGEALAILAGDALLTDAFALLAGGEGSERHRLLLCRELAVAAGSRGMVGGQVDDMEGAATTLVDLESMHARKTGALIRAACRGPALLAPAAHLEALSTYGEALGVAFQIADDLLDVEGSAATLGKAVSKDAAQGKATYPALLGVEGARRAAREAVDRSRAALGPLPGDAGSLLALAEYTLARER
jgi:geranylgeranyl diphosphate synthase type II